MQDIFAPGERGLDERDQRHARLRAAGPVVQSTAPAGGPVWIITDEDVAREVLSDPRVVKDPAFAPQDWDPRTAGLEPPAATQPSLTTLDGEDHAQLRRSFAPLLSAKRVSAQSERVHDIARELLTPLASESSVDLMSDFTSRYPLTVLLDLLGIPLDYVDDAIAGCQLMFSDDPSGFGTAMGALMDIAASGLRDNSTGLAVELRERMPAAATEQQLRYHLFGLIFAGQLTTDAALGFLIAQLLRDNTSSIDDLVHQVLRDHPPAPFTLWRFTSTAMELGGFALPARSPILVDIAGVNTDPARRGNDLTFGAGPHFCIGAQLAQLELRAIAAVLRTDFPHATLSVTESALRQHSDGGIASSRLRSLPVTLHPA